MEETTAPAGFLSCSENRTLFGQAVSIALHVALLVVCWKASPALEETYAPLPSIRSAYLFPTLAVAAAPEMEPDASYQADFEGNPWEVEEGAGLAWAEDEDGQPGTPDAEVAAGRRLVEGPHDNPDPWSPERGAHARTYCCLMGPQKGSEGSAEGLLAVRDGIGLSPELVNGNTQGPEAVASFGRGGSGTDGSGQGGRALTCVRRGAGKGPVRHVRRIPSPATDSPAEAAALAPSASAGPASPPLRRMTKIPAYRPDENGCGD